MLYQAVNHKNLVHSSYATAHGAKGRAAVVIIGQTVVEIFVTSQEKKEGKQTLTQPVMITLIHVWKKKKRDIKRRRSQKGSKGQTNGDGQTEVTFESAARPSRCCCVDWGFLPAVSSHPLSDGRPQLASCFSLTNGNFTVLHQSVVFTSLSPALPRARNHCLPPAAMWLSYRCLLEISAGLTPFIPLLHALGKDVLPVVD